MLSWWRVSLVALFFGCSALVFGQATSSLRGTVSDTSGAAIPKAAVTLSNAATGFARTTATASDGTYQFVELTPGKFQLSIEAPGFKKAELNDIEVLVSTAATADVALQVGTQAEKVNVTAEATTLNTQDATIGNAFQENQIKELPIESRNVVDLLSLQAGVVYTGNRDDIDLTKDSRSGAVNGARSDQTTVSLDGVNATDQANGYAFTSVLRTTPDSLQEFRVTTTNPQASDGSSSGAQVALVTKSGSNAFHGSLYYYLRNTATSANDYFIKLAQDASGEPNKALKLNRNIPGVSLGGPILKDRAFFFLNYEGRRDSEQQSVVTEVPTATLRAGSVLYPSAAGNIVNVTPQDFQRWDPLGIGPSAAVLNYFNSFPLPNDPSVGDGLNFSGYRFAAPISNRFDVYIARFDYKLDSAGKHTLFWRGSMQNDYENGAPYLPGMGPQTVTEDRSKGFALGYTAVLTPNVVNEFRWGFTRQSLGVLGDSNQPYVQLNQISEGITRTNAYTLPVNNLVDNMTWVKGRHTIQFGANIVLMHQRSVSLGNTFNQAALCTTCVNTGGFATTGNAFDPGAEGFPAVSPNFTTGYDQAAFDVLGIVSQVTGVYNYTKSGSVLPEGTPIRRDYAVNEFDEYIQDSFRFRPNFTVTYGLRYQLELPPYEVNGLQVSSTTPLGDWLSIRADEMKAGIPSNQDPVLSYVLGGAANNGPPLYNTDYHNFAPRVSFAYSPHPTSGFARRLFGDSKTSIRGGFSVAYDHNGTELLNYLNQTGAFGLSTSLQSLLGGQSVDCAPRITTLNTIPTEGCGGQILRPAPPGGFPQTPPIGIANGGFSYSNGVDQNLKTPYVYMVDFSIGRELTRSSSLEVSYVGRFAHRLLSLEDFGEPLDLTDPASGVDYFTAMSRLSQLARQNVPVSAVNPSLVGPTAAYWSDLFSPLAANGTGYFGASCTNPGQCSPVQAAYDLERRYLYNETFIPYFLDGPGFICPNGCSKLGPYTFYNAQYFGLYGWTSQGNSNYNALQVTYRKRLSNGVQFDLNYTFSRSMDLVSDATRVGTGTGGFGNGVGIVNSWDYKQLYGPSDFDMRHQFNANYVIELPVGRGRHFAANASRTLDAFIGGWQLAGIYRITSGLPFQVSNGINLPTDGANSGLATLTGPVQQGGATKTGDGRVLLFSNPTAAFNAFEFTYPGQSGTRNPVRGDGFLSWDSSLSKRWRMPFNEAHSLQFRWEVFNVGNFTRFNVQSNQPVLTDSTNFGTYTGLLTNPRVMQFGLRYEF
jgi:hypothetical protein